VTAEATVRARLFTLLTRAAGDPHSLWDRVKRSQSGQRSGISRRSGAGAVAADQHVMARVFADVPDVKVKQFAAEARSWM
jgi:hypothetical protein